METEINPAQLEPFQSAKRVVTHISSVMEASPTPKTFLVGMRALDYWQVESERRCAAQFASQASPGSPLHTMLVLSHRAGMKIVKRLRGQLAFFLEGGKWTFRPDWDESWN